MSKKEQALEAIRQLITDRKIGNDNEFFSENELCRLLGMSRSPIRDALAALASEGLVEQIPQVGIRRRKYTDGDLREIYEVRSFVEPFATEQAAFTSNDASIDKLQNLLEQMKEGASECDVNKFLTADVKFHEELALGAQMHFVADLIKQIGAKVRIIGHQSTPDTESMLEVCEEHRQILSAVKEKNPKNAHRMAMKHIKETKHRLEEARGKPIFS